MEGVRPGLRREVDSGCAPACAEKCKATMAQGDLCASRDEIAQRGSEWNTEHPPGGHETVRWNTMHRGHGSSGATIVSSLREHKRRHTHLEGPAEATTVVYCRDSPAPLRSNLRIAVQEYGQVAAEGNHQPHVLRSFRTAIIRPRPTAGAMESGR